MMRKLTYDQALKLMESVMNSDAECINCEKPFISFGTIPLCAVCTRAHFKEIPVKRIAPLLGEGAEELRKAVTVINMCRESFNDLFTAEELILLYRALKRSEWDILPDRWTPEEVALALTGKGTGATSDR